MLPLPPIFPPVSGERQGAAAGSTSAPAGEVGEPRTGGLLEAHRDAGPFVEVLHAQSTMRQLRLGDIWPLPERLQHPDWYRNVTLLLAVRQVPVSSSLEMSRVPELIGLFSVHSREGPVLIDGALEVAASSISARSHRGRASVERLSHAALLSRQCCIEEMYEARDSVFYLRAKLCGRDVSVMVPTPRSLFCAPVTLLLRANLLVARSRQIQLPCAALASDDAYRARFLGPYRLRVICCAAIAPASQVTARASAARAVPARRFRPPDAKLQQRAAYGVRDAACPISTG